MKVQGGLAFWLLVLGLKLSQLSEDQEITRTADDPKPQRMARRQTVGIILLRRSLTDVKQTGPETGHSICIGTRMRSQGPLAAEEARTPQPDSPKTLNSAWSPRFVVEFPSDCTRSTVTRSDNTNSAPFSSNPQQKLQTMPVCHPFLCRASLDLPDPWKSPSQTCLARSYPGPEGFLQVSVVHVAALLNLVLSAWADLYGLPRGLLFGVRINT